MEISIEILVINGAKAHIIYKVENGIKFYLTPKLKFNRHLGSRGYIREWSKVTKIIEKIFAGEISNDCI